MKYLSNKLIKFKQWILFIVNISVWILQLKSSKILYKIGVPRIISLILVGVHYKKRHYKHQYEIGIWKYIMIFY